MDSRERSGTMCPAAPSGAAFQTAPMTFKNSCLALAFLLLTGSASVQAGSAEADPLSDYNTGMRFHAAGNIPKAMESFRRGADQGEPNSEMALATYYYLGDGVKPDYERALDLLLSASSKGSPAADYLLSQMYEDGKGVERDEDQAVEYLISAAYDCFRPAQLELADRHHVGKGVRKDYLQTLAWLTMAGEGGDQEARDRVRDAVEQMRADDNRKLEVLVGELRDELSCP